MLISAEMFSDIVSKLTSDPQALRSNERRNAPRVGIRAKLEIERNITGERAMVQLRELSRSGIGFLHMRKLVPAEIVRARFPGNGGKIVVAEYEIRHCTQISGGPCIIGAQLKNLTLVDASGAARQIGRTANPAPPSAA
ncbi:MAG TPA: PilZ domain-containing protein [Tepidisphaeraceae bacterium]|jgi:hypothetical protein